MCKSPTSPLRVPAFQGWQRPIHRSVRLAAMAFSFLAPRYGLRAGRVRIFRAAAGSARRGIGGGSRMPRSGLTTLIRVGTMGVTSLPVARREKGGATATGPPRTVRISKWLGSGVGKSPPQRPPSAFQSVPNSGQKSGVVLAGKSPTRRSAANEGHLTCWLCGWRGLTEACKLGER